MTEYYNLMILEEVVNFLEDKAQDPLTDGSVEELLDYMAQKSRELFDQLAEASDDDWGFKKGERNV